MKNHKTQLSSADKEELQKCKNSPVYFYNKYVRKEGQQILTEREYTDFLKMMNYQVDNPLILRNKNKGRQLTPKECYNKLPNFLKKS